MQPMIGDNAPLFVLLQNVHRNEMLQKSMSCNMGILKNVDLGVVSILLKINGLHFLKYWLP